MSHLISSFFNFIPFQMSSIHNSVFDLFSYINQVELEQKVKFIKQSTTKLFGTEGMFDQVLFISFMCFMLLRYYLLC